MTLRASVRRVDLLSLSAAFLLSRLVAVRLAHVSFDAAPLFEDYVQYLDVGSLQHRLLESLYYWHSQPPLFNGFLGAVLQTVPDRATTAFQTVFLLCGLTLTVSIYHLQLTVGVDRRLAWIGALFFMVGPAALLHENWLFYTYPLTALLVVAAVTYATDLQRKTAWTAFTYFASLAALVLSQSVFAIWWFAGLVGLHLLLEQSRRRQLMRAAGFPVLCVVALAVRSYHFTGSLSTGQVYASFQLAVNVVDAVPRGALASFEREGKASPLLLMPPYRPLAEYAPPFTPTISTTGEPLLDDPVKPGGQGFRNFNALGYLELSRVLRADALSLLRRYPGRYLRRTGTRFAEQYFMPAERHPPFFAGYPNQGRIAGWSRLFSRLVLLQPAPGRPAWLFIVLFPLTIVAAIRSMARRASPGSEVPRRLIGFMLFNILYITALTVFLTGVEINRYRFFVDPFFLVLATFGLQRLADSWLSSRRA